MIGTKENLAHTVKMIESHGHKVKVETETKDYLGCEILIDSKSGLKTLLGQPFIEKKILSCFAELIGGLNVKYKTPGTPGFNIIHHITPEEQISVEDKSINHAGVGTLLYLIKYSRPYLSNIVQELSKCMDKTTPAAFKALKRVMHFVAATKDYGLKVEPTKVDPDMFNWNMVAYTDSDWAANKEEGHSISS
jgi:hypothetical protein